MPSMSPDRPTPSTETRRLPKYLNPELPVDVAPPYEELVQKRSLGRTNLQVRANQVDTTNATKRENLGIFDYAHLRGPLPDNLKGSEIFKPAQHQQTPDTYFLMRRSSDGYISATGMFKLAFPWAKHSEETAERNYIKTFPSTSQDEIAGNVWVQESFALELAKDYAMTHWVMALLDPRPIKPVEDAKKAISTPPPYVFTANDQAQMPPPTPQRGATPRARGRPRGSTPARSTPAPKASSPRKREIKPKTPKAPSVAEVEADIKEQAKEASESLQNALNSAANAAEKGAEKVIDKVTEKTGGKVAKKAAAEPSTKASSKKETPKTEADDHVKIEVDSAVQVNGNVETTTTNVKVHIPGGAELPHPENPEKMIEQAKLMVQEAKKLEGSTAKSSKSKRKAEVLDDEEDDDDDEGDEEDDNQPAKRQRLLQQKLKTERVRNRALTLTGAVATVGTLAMWLMQG